MPFRIRCFEESRKNPNSRASKRAGNALLRRGKVNIGGRYLKAGRGVVFSDAAMQTHMNSIAVYQQAGMIEVTALPGSSDDVLKGWAAAGGGDAPAAAIASEITAEPEAAEPEAAEASAESGPETSSKRRSARRAKKAK